MATSNLHRTVLSRAASVLCDEMRIAPVQFTATGGGTTSVASTSAQWNKTAATAYNGYYATVLTDAGGAAAAPEGESKLISAYVTATNTLTTGTFSAAVASGDTILLSPLPQAAMTEAINDVIRNLPLPRYLPVTLITDGDMEATGTTSWADVTGAPTQTKETTIVLTGTQSLKLVHTVVDTSVGSVAVPVTENEQITVWAPVKCTAGSLQVQVWDATNSVEIESATVDEEAWTLVWFQNLTVPANCQNITIRLVNKTAATTTYVDHVGFLRSRWQDVLYDLPSQITDATLLDGISYLNPTQNSEAEFAYIWDGDFEPLGAPDIKRDYRGVNSNRVEIPWSARPLFYEFRATNTALSAMADVFYGSSDLLEAVVEGTAAGCFRKLQMEGKAQQHKMIYKGLLRSLGIGDTETQYVPQRRVYAPTTR